MTDAERKHLWYVAHRDECIARTLKWRKNNPDGRRKHRRTARGVVDATGEQKISPCEVCLRIMTLRQDHDHLTGKRRGWLCNRCNIALGWLQILSTDSFDKSLITYLAKHKGDK